MVATATVPPVALDPDLAKRLRRAGERVDADLVERDKLIARAYFAGASLREIGEAVGISHVGVKKILDRTKVVRIQPEFADKEMTLREAMAAGIFETETAQDPDE